MLITKNNCETGNNSTNQSTSAHETSKTSIRRQRPAKPVKQTPVQKTKIATSAEALYLLNEFVKEARKEIRKRETLILNGNVTKTDCDNVTFLGESFSLTINFKERLAV